eukprot:m.167578 g.167578  ORF g.167578 m.167578 type:complete len:123 (-) comp16454_c0_seq10:855-1223(-)
MAHVNQNVGRRGTALMYVYNAQWSDIYNLTPFFSSSGIDNFIAMFSGYQSRPYMVLESLKRAGHNMQDIEKDMLTWGPRDLHVVIAHFLRIRFPMLLALNKVQYHSGWWHPVCLILLLHVTV